MFTLPDVRDCVTQTSLYNYMQLCVALLTPQCSLCLDYFVRVGVFNYKVRIYFIRFRDLFLRTLTLIIRTTQEDIVFLFLSLLYDENCHCPVLVVN